MSTPRSGDAGTSGRLLVRSGIEIGRTLEAVRADGGALAASLEQGELLFVSRLLYVDEAGGAIVVAYSESKEANAALLALPSIAFSCSHGGVRHQFVAAEPHETQHAGAPAIRLRFPALLLSTQRRSHARIPIPPKVPLRCIIGYGMGSLDARVVDISRGGIGTLIYEGTLRMPPGTRLEGVRIVHPDRTITLDLEVRHVVNTILSDGRGATRVGCRFLGAPRDLADLIRLFVTRLAD